LKIVAFVLLAVLAQILLDYSLRKEFKVQSKGIVVITGTSTGIGRHAAFEMAKNGYIVFCGVRNQKGVQSLKDEAKSLGLEKEIRPIILDIEYEEQIDAAVSEVSSYSDSTSLPIVGLVNNAGISMRSPYESTLISQMKKVFEINFFGTTLITQKFLPLIRRDQGRVVFISSMMGVTSLYGSSSYSASKRAMEGAVDALRIEMLPFGVSVSSVLPGYIKTAIGDKGNDINVTDEQYKIYQDYFDTVVERRKKTFTIAAGPEVTSEAILHALTNPFPLTRYYPGSTGDLSAKMAAVLLGIFPDRAADLVKSLRNK